MKGIHFPNRILEPGELDEILSTGCDNYVIYVWSFAVDDLIYWHSVCSEIKRRIPDSKIHIRLEHRGVLTDPSACARTLVNVAYHFTDVATSFRWGNEPNLETPATHYQWSTWLSTIAKEVFKASPNINLYVPAIAPWAPNWKAWVVEAKILSLSKYFAGFDIHVYKCLKNIKEILQEYDCVGSKPRVVTEYNPGDTDFTYESWAQDLPNVMSECARHGVNGVCLFIWDWANPDQPYGKKLSFRGTPVVPALTKLKEVVLTVDFEGEGFKALANKLGREVVGEPVIHARAFNGYGDTEQITTKGRMVWTKAANVCQFFQAYSPKV